MSDRELEHLAATTTRKVFNRGDLLFALGDKVSHLYVVVGGWVKVGRETLDGAEAVLDVVSTGALLGEMALVGTLTHTSTATTVETCEALCVPLQPLLEMLEHHPRMALQLARILAGIRNKQDMEMESRMLKNAPQRLACYLLRLCPVNQQPGKMVLHLPYDKMLLAARLGMQPETFSRALAKLKEEINLVIRGSSVEINDMQRLQIYACQACSSFYPCPDMR